MHNTRRPSRPFRFAGLSDKQAMDIPSKRITFGITDFSDDNESYALVLEA
jgi:hypothetical protein